jgi:signal transduction histidine kinase
MIELNSELSKNIELIVNSIGDAVVAVDGAGKMVFYNAAAEEVLGVKISVDEPDKWVGHFGVFCPDQITPFPSDKLPLLLAVKGESTDGIIQFIRNKNRPNGIFISINGRPILNKDSKIIGGVVVVRDVTVKMKIEEEIKIANIELKAINKELESFSYAVSHDLRTPLRSIIGFSDILLKKFSSQINHEGLDYLNRIRDSGYKLGQLIDGLLDLSRLTRGELKLEKVDLSEIVKNVASDLKVQDSNRKIQFTIADSVVADADSRLLRSVIINLMSNACKFSSKKEESKVEFGTITKDPKKTTYFIKDNGVGFDEKYSNKLFNIFQRLHSVNEFEGNGIGLATVQRIIHKHGGSIWAEGRLNEGATFYFTLLE